jgi:hypothetical protein
MSAARKLAAILAADVAGYSRLMGVDEEGTHNRLKAHRRELIDPKIKEHHGRIVKTTGDGILIEFPSVVEAVRCAVEVQQGIVERNADVPQEKRIEFRVGINLGDIIVEGKDIHGDGVNVAARLEALAEPGGSQASANSSCSGLLESAIAPRRAGVGRLWLGRGPAEDVVGEMVGDYDARSHQRARREPDACPCRKLHPNWITWVDRVI